MSANHVRLHAAALALLLALVLTAASAPLAQGKAFEPDTVNVRSGPLTLHALLWSPAGSGPFPAVLFNHGSYSSDDKVETEQIATLGSVFAGHGYVFLFPFRRGVGLSADQGVAGGDLMHRALAAQGPEARNSTQLQLLENEELGEAVAALAFLKTLPNVDPHRLAVVGHSFGGSLTLFLAARDRTIRAVVSFAAAAHSWELSWELRTRLLAAVVHAPPVFFIHAANDFSTTPGKILAAEMQRLAKPHLLKIYPAVGKTNKEGHHLVFSDIVAWEPDVFAFLDEYTPPLMNQETRKRTHP